MFITGLINEKQRLRGAGKRWSALAPFICLMAAPGFAQEAACPAINGQQIQIESVDTHLEIRLADGRKLRLRGIDPPRGTAANPQLAEQARTFLADAIAGHSLRADIAPGERDRWGRNLATLALPDSTPAAHALIAAGWARVEPGDAETGCLPALFQLEAAARLARRGLWADPAYAMLQATDHAGFAQLNGQIVIMEGRVSSAGKWRTLTFLNLGTDRRTDPAVVLSRRMTIAMEKSGRAPESLRGAQLRVRGQLQIRNSPRIEIFSPAAIEIIDAGTGARAMGANRDINRAPQKTAN